MLRPLFKILELIKQRRINKLKCSFIFHASFDTSGFDDVVTLCVFVHPAAELDDLGGKNFIIYTPACMHDVYIIYLYITLIYISAQERLMYDKNGRVMYRYNYMYV